MTARRCGLRRGELRLHFDGRLLIRLIASHGRVLDGAVTGWRTSAVELLLELTLP